MNITALYDNHAATCVVCDDVVGVQLTDNEGIPIIMDFEYNPLFCRFGSNSLVPNPWKDFLFYDELSEQESQSMLSQWSSCDACLTKEGMWALSLVKKCFHVSIASINRQSGLC